MLPSAVSVGAAGLTVTLETTGLALSSTVRRVVPETAPVVAVIVDVPLATAVASPVVELIVATPAALPFPARHLPGLRRRQVSLQ